MFFSITRVLLRRSTYISNFRNITIAHGASSSNSFTIQDPEDFDNRVLNNKKPVIVDFHATWCNPCKLLAPRIEHVIDEKKGKVLLAKVDIDELSDIALDHEVSAVPVLLAFCDGKPKERLVGLQDEDKLRAFVNRLLGE